MEARLAPVLVVEAYVIFFRELPVGPEAVDVGMVKHAADGVGEQLVYNGGVGRLAQRKSLTKGGRTL